MKSQSLPHGPKMAAKALNIMSSHSSIQNTKGRRKRSRDQDMFLLEPAEIVMIPQMVSEKCMETLMSSQWPGDAKGI